MELYFYPRPPRGGRPVRRMDKQETGQFLSTPSARRATIANKERQDLNEFLSTPSARRATVLPEQPRRYEEISIHALREEGDKSACTNLAEAGNFYPRPPRGGRRLQEIDARKKARKFLSTPSARRATRAARSCKSASIFLSTPSARRATTFSRHHHVAEAISIHALREEGDWLSSLLARRLRISIHALREEGDRHLRKARPAGHEISIHALREEGDWRGTLSSRATQISIHALREEGDLHPESTQRCC